MVIVITYDHPYHLTDFDARLKAFGCLMITLRQGFFNSYCSLVALLCKPQVEMSP